MNDRPERISLDGNPPRALRTASQRQAPPRGVRGNAATALVVLVVLIAFGFGALFFLSAGSVSSVSPPPSGHTSSAPVGPSPTSSGSQGVSGPRPTEPGERTSASDGTGIEFRRRSDYAKSFDGVGTLFVDVRTEPGKPFPEAWKLHLEPSATQAGREHAESRTLEYPGPQRSVEVVDLPLGAYDVYATAPGLTSLPSPVVLHGIEGDPHATGGMFKRMTMTMISAPSVEQRVRRANGLPADGLDVHLQRVVGDGHYTTQTDGNGMALFDGVAPGSWLLSTGEVQRSWTQVARVEVGTKPVRLDDLTLPPLVDVELTAIDDLERPLPGARMTGYRRANGSGQLEGTTDEMGRLRARYLPLGPWRFEGDHDELQLSGMRDHKLALEGEHAAPADGVVRLNVLLQPRTSGAR